MAHSSRTFILSALAVLLLCLPSYAEDFSGQVVGIIDGDTIEVMHLGKAERIRLHGVDCPEMGQPFGKRAKQYTSTHTFRKTVRIIVHDVDRYGRTVGQVILPDMSNLNIVLVSAGLAWWYERYAPEDETLKSIQKSAKVAKRGVCGPTLTLSLPGSGGEALERHLVISLSNPNLLPRRLMVIRLSTSPGQGRSITGTGVSI